MITNTVHLMTESECRLVLDLFAHETEPGRCLVGAREALAYGMCRTFPTLAAEYGYLFEWPLSITCTDEN